nr:hypothetical protein B0A51_01129 [Rachicladosporium sp. CCFEE 5018]
MSSPLRRSVSRSTPARHTPNGFRRTPANGRPSPRVDSPAQQLADEFSRIVLDADRDFHNRLDATSDEQERCHLEALAKALAEHEAVRASAERARERLELEMERMKQKREADEKAGVERERRKLADERAAVDEAQEKERREHEDRAAAKLRAKQENDRKAAKEKADVEQRERKEAEAAKVRSDAYAKAQRDAQAKPQASQTPQAVSSRAIQAPATRLQPPAPSTPHVNGATQAAHAAPAATAPSYAATVDAAALQFCGPLTPMSVVTPMNARESEHQRYLDLHRRLKQMRKDVLTEAQRLGVKDQLSNKRRELTTAIGQTNKHDKAAQQATMRKVRDIVIAGAKILPTRIDISPYIISVSPVALKGDNADTLGPAGLLFMLSWLAKTVIRQFAAEASDDGKAADPIGVLTVTIFANPDLRPNGVPLIDMLWAKYHKVCPALFGISGTQNTKAGRLRLGWDLDEDDAANYRRFRGFAVGFAAITLRDFSKSKNPNPAPNALYWTSLARILSTPAGLQSSTQYTILQHMIHLYVHRFIQFYGAAAVAAIRKACYDFPATAPRLSSGGDDPAVQAMKSLPFSLKKEYQLTL